MTGHEAIEWCQDMRNTAKGYDKKALTLVVDFALGYIIGMSPADYQKVELWIKGGMKKSPETAFTAGPSRQCARLIRSALEQQKRSITNGNPTKITINKPKVKEFQKD